MIKQQQPPPEGPIYKKIQNYIFKFSDLLGQGNFSKVYRAHNELTSKTSINTRLNSGHKDSRTVVPQEQEALGAALLVDRRAKKTQPPQRPQMP